MNVDRNPVKVALGDFVDDLKQPCSKRIFKQSILDWILDGTVLGAMITSPAIALGVTASHISPSCLVSQISSKTRAPRRELTDIPALAGRCVYRLAR